MASVLKRIVLCYVLSTVLMLLCVLRVFAVMKSENYRTVADTMSSRVIKLNGARGTVFDTDMNRITNSRTAFYTVITDSPSVYASLFNFFDAEETNSIIEEIRQQGFALRITASRLASDGIYSFPASVHADDSLLAKHIVGYIDGEGHGVSGLEAAFDSMLYTGEVNTVSFTLDGHGKKLGAEPDLKYDYAAENRGVKTTIDVDIQRIAEQEALVIDKGAVVISEISTGKIRAMVSRPDFRISDLASALSSENSPLLNRALCTYNAGSVFKPFVAAAGYEKGIALDVECVGYTDIDNLSFACHNLAGHGVMNLHDALKFSCNCFFYVYSQSVGAESIVSIAKKAGVADTIRLAEGLVCQKGSIGSTATLKKSARALANFSIGQGELMISPLVFCNIYSAIASDGTYRPPTLVEGIVEKLKLTEEYPISASVRIMSQYTASRLKEDLSSVLEEGGTGHNATPLLCSAAGKTGTAQTGIKQDGKKVNNSWFCGFFPYDNPKYTVVVLSQNAKTPPAQVFASVADGITSLGEGQEP